MRPGRSRETSRSCRTEVATPSRRCCSPRRRGRGRRWPPTPARSCRRPGGLRRGRRTRSAGTGSPISSWNSRQAATNGSSSAPYSPLGIDHAPSSLRAQIGPPMWPSSTSSCPPDSPVQQDSRAAPRHRITATNLRRTSEATGRVHCCEPTLRCKPPGAVVLLIAQVGSTLLTRLTRLMLRSNDATRPTSVVSAWTAFATTRSASNRSRSSARK